MAPEPNQKTLEALVKCLEGQGMIEQVIPFEELFVAVQRIKWRMSDLSYYFIGDKNRATRCQKRALLRFNDRQPSSQCSKSTQCYKQELYFSLPLPRPGCSSSP